MEPITLLIFITSSHYGYSFLMNISNYWDQQTNHLEIRNEIIHLRNDIAYLKSQTYEIQRIIKEEILNRFKDI